MLGYAIFQKSVHEIQQSTKILLNWHFIFAVREAFRTAAAIWHSYSQSLTEFTRTSPNNLRV